MPQTKQASKGKRPTKAISVLGVAGVSLAASTSASVEMPLANPAPFQVMTLGEEEISDVSLATFHLFDKDGLGTPAPAIQLARGGGCGCGHGCGGHGGCGGRGCGHGCGRGCGHGCGRGCGWGGCGGWGWGGCCLSWGGCRYC
jgi:hypothetical protein